MNSGLRAGYGWGAERPGVFLSKDPETAAYWSKKSVEKSDDSNESPLILQIDIPEDAVGNLVPRRTDFAKDGDMQYLGEIPPNWIKPLSSIQTENFDLLRKFIRHHLI
jgi:hypothetical protein